MFFSVVIPVYNRPQEIQELLESLTQQSYSDFEVLIIEDGSKEKCLNIVESFSNDLDIRYFYKENSGQGFSRNYGFEHAKGDYFVVFDSDCLIPDHYFETVAIHLSTHKLDAYGGPDKAHASFSTLQKAISYSMTSPLTTGGIRGNKKHAGTFHPRSFNMGISREVFKKTGGYNITRMGEDIEFSLRIIEHGFKTGLIPDAYVYHKRRTSLAAFFKQLHFFGRARINISRFFPHEVKFVHFIPSIFTLGLLVFLSLPLWSLALFKIGLVLFILFALSLAVDATLKNKNPLVGILSIATSIIQLTAYGVGFIKEWVVKTFE